MSYLVASSLYNLVKCPSHDSKASMASKNKGRKQPLALYQQGMFCHTTLGNIQLVASSSVVVLEKHS